MKNLITLCCCLFSILNITFAQKTLDIGIIKGALYSADNQPVAYASVSLLNEKEELIIGSISEEDGAFLFENLVLDTFILEAKFLGYQTHRQTLILSPKNKKYDLGKLILEADQQQLDEVVVTAEKSQYRLQLDKKIFEVGQDALSQGGSALDILDQVPQVAVTPAGAVTLRGSSAVQILINGKRSGLTMNNALEQIPSDNIERIEVMTNPSASYDASGTAGIINIILKRNKGEGWSGRVLARVGTPADNTVRPGLNYRGKKINAFANLGWRYSDYVGRYTTTQRTMEDGNTSFLDRNENEDRHDDGRSGYFGADFYFNPQNTVTLAYYRSETKDTDLTLIDYNLENTGQEKNAFLRTGNSVENRNYNQIEANYTHDFTRKGEKISTDFQYDFWNSNKNWDLGTTGDDVPTYVGRDLRTNNKAGSRDWIVKSDYKRPLNNGAKIELGAKIENRIVKNNYRADILEDEVWKLYQNIDNDIKYSEKIAAAYAKYQGKLKAIEYSLGLRSEYTMIDIEDVENTFTNDNNYLNFFPSVHLSYALNEANEFQLSYTKRINRPSLWSLYPFFEITDFNAQYTGNPLLQPSYSDAYELSYLLVSDKVTLNPNIYFRHTIDPTEYYLTRNEQNTFITKPVNIETRNDAGFELSLNYKPVKILRLSTEFNIYRFDQKGTYEGQDLSAKGNAWSAGLNARMNLPKDFTFRLNFDYWSGEKGAQTRQLPSYLLTFGAGKSFFDDKLDISIRAFNVLDSRERRTISEAPNFYIERSDRRNKERFAFQVIYKFNQVGRMRSANRGNR